MQVLKETDVADQKPGVGGRLVRRAINAVARPVGYVMLRAHHGVSHPKARSLLAGTFGPDKDRLLIVDAQETFVVNMRDQVIGRDLYAHGHFDFDKFVRVIDLLGGKVDLLIDVGANIGTISIPAVNRGLAARAIAIEPDPRNCRLLRANIALNGLDQRMTVHEAALGAEEGTLELELAEDNFGDHRIKVSSDGGIYNEDRRASVTVKGTTLDAVCPSGEGALIWIDTQGYEGFVLEGGGRLLAGQPPLALEFWPYGMSRAGSYDRLKAAIGHYGGFVDLARPGQRRPISDLGALWQEVGVTGEHTDILVTRAPV